MKGHSAVGWGEYIEQVVRAVDIKFCIQDTCGNHTVTLVGMYVKFICIREINSVLFISEIIPLVF